MPILTAGYAALFALLLVALSINVIRLRYRYQVSLGDGGEDRLRRAIRGQGNFAEYVPITLILMLCLELLAQPGWLIHGVGLALLAGRLTHGACFAFFDSAMALRRAGMIFTFGAIVTAAVATLAAAVATAT